MAGPPSDLSSQDIQSWVGSGPPLKTQVDALNTDVTSLKRKFKDFADSTFTEITGHARLHNIEGREVRSEFQSQHKRTRTDLEEGLKGLRTLLYTITGRVKNVEDEAVPAARKVHNLDAEISKLLENTTERP